MKAVLENKYICRYCGKECKNPNSLRNHERLCKRNPNHQISSFVAFNKLKTDGVIDVWNKGLTKENDDRVKQMSQTLSKRYRNGEITPSFLNKKHTETTKRHLSDISKENHDKGIGHTWVHRPDKPSYAEQWLYNVLEKHNIPFKREVPFYGFFLDVVIGDNICIEIDGEQHYDSVKFPNQQDTDRRKDQLLKENNWNELRVRWKYVLKDKTKYEDIILNFIEKYN